MKSTRWMKWAFCLVFAWGLVVSVQARKEEITLLLVPREDTAKRIGLDIASRYPTLLVSYLTTPNGGVSLHGWTGKRWVKITPADYTAGTFFKKGPNSALIVEKKGASVPESLIPPEEWCTDVSKVTTTETRPLLHLVGQYYNFKYKDWKWFAKRYGQDVDAINPEGLNTAWYHKRLDEHLKGGAPIGSGDLQYWLVVRETKVVQPPVVEPTEVESVDPLEDPFTNAVPPAVVMGAGDAPEEPIAGEDKPDEEKKPVPEEKKPSTTDSAE